MRADDGLAVSPLHSPNPLLTLTPAFPPHFTVTLQGADAPEGPDSLAAQDNGLARALATDLTALMQRLTLLLKNEATIKVWGCGTCGQCEKFSRGLSSWIWGDLTTASLELTSPTPAATCN